MSLATIGAGAGAGFLVGGPIGAVVGAVAGAVMASKPAVVEVGPANTARSAQASADLINALTSSPGTAIAMPPSSADVDILTSPGGVPYIPGYTMPGFMRAPGLPLVDGPLLSPAPPSETGLIRPPLAGFGDIGKFPLWLTMVGLGTAAYVFWRK